MDIKRIAYEKYKLNWLLRHGYNLTDLMNELDKLQEENPDDSVSQLFADWEYGFGFRSEVWVSYQEFLNNEYLDTGYMRELLNFEEWEQYEHKVS